MRRIVLEYAQELIPPLCLRVPRAVVSAVTLLDSGTRTWHRSVRTFALQSAIADERGCGAAVPSLCIVSWMASCIRCFDVVGIIGCGDRSGVVLGDADRRDSPTSKSWKDSQLLLPVSGVVRSSLSAGQNAHEPMDGLRVPLV